MKRINLLQFYHNQLELEFLKLLETQTNFGRNQIKEIFLQAQVVALKSTIEQMEKVTNL